MPIYHARMTSGALLINESRKIAGLFKEIDINDKSAWQKAIITDNVLQKRSPESAKRLANYIRQRLKNAPPCLIDIVLNSSADVVTQALFAIAINYDHLLGDFIDQVVRDRIRRFKKSLPRQLWDEFLNNCSGYAPEVKKWSKNTCTKLGQTAFLILTQAGYIENTKSRKFQPVYVYPEIKSCLTNAGQDYVLRCMEVAE